MPTPALSRPLCSFLMSLWLLFIPSLVQAEAFKGGFLSSGEEKTLFFVALLIFIVLLISLLGTLRGIWEWLNTGNSDKFKRAFQRFLLAILGVALALFLLFMSFLG